MSYTKNTLILALSSLLVWTNGFSQQSETKKELEVVGVGFYNLENLFDTIIDPDPNKILQEAFTPHGKNAWTSEKYHDKLDKMARVISEIGTAVTPDGLAILGVSEVENESVLIDLVNHKTLRNRGYKVVHYDSPDRRGIDVGLLYNPNYFKVESSRSVSLRSIDTTFYTRDQLLVTGLLNDERVHLIVAHWPSRRGGEKRSKPRRMAAAKLARSIIDSIRITEPEAKIIFMGDLNDNPTDASLKKEMKSVGKQELATKNKLYNPMEAFYKKGIGSQAYRDVWGFFDQIVLTPSLLGKDYSSFKYYKAKVFNPSYMIQTAGKYKGYPFRSYSNGSYVGGYSDHFPVYLFLVREKK